MGKRFFILFFLLLSLLLSSMLSATEARALKDSKLQYSKAGKKINEATLRGLSLRAVKVSGPSPGVGHRYKNLQTIGLENSGPGPGEGHK
ncbi:precursor of CEP16-like [Herrania umbratica]|uniref:Precursor of CEP16-like n=1 Tax=Herrania umbratica TaxID=108875 RepID=A0A6J1B0Y0_9ROSI|nr:precursor of CEP16-like [Herrania umbratica]